LIFGPAVFNRHVLTLEVAGLLQALAECAQTTRESVSRAGLRNPITGIVGDCARAASGTAAAPPRRIMSSRRFMTETPSQRPDLLSHGVAPLLQQHACNTATRKTNRMQHCKAKKRMASAAELSPTSARAARIRGAQLSREPRYSSKELLEPLTERDELGVCCCRHARFAL
jgi:hypothetical protein